MKFADILIELLSQRDISIYRLCKSLSLDQSMVRRWLQDGRMPSAENLIKLADYFGVTIDYLLKGEQKPATHDEQPVDPELAELWKEFDDMSLEEAAKTLEYVRLLKLKRMT